MLTYPVVKRPGPADPLPPRCPPSRSARGTAGAAA